MSDDLLAGLDSVPWERYRHAYVQAVDTPTHLGALLSEDAQEREQANYNLAISIAHQGTLYEATSYAVPFLIAIVDAPASQDKGQILATLAVIAEGTFHNRYISEQQRFLTELDTPEARREVETKRGWVRRAHAAVRAGREVYLRLLSDPDPQTRQEVLGVLVAAFGDNGAGITPTIRQRIASEDDPAQRARLARALAEFVPVDDPTQALLTQVWHADVDAFVQLAAAVALAHGLGEQAPAHVEDTLTHMLVSPEPNIEKRFREIRSNYDIDDTDLALGLNAMGARGVTTALPPLLDALATRCAAMTVETLPEGHIGVSHKPFIADDGTRQWRDVKGRSIYPRTMELRLTETVLLLTFGRRRRKHSTTPTILTPAQRRALSAIASYDVLWHFDATMDDLLADRDLPYAREGLRAYLLRVGSPP